MAGMYPNMHFILCTGGQDIPCKSFHNFEQEIEYEAIQEGGLNDSVHIRKKPVSKPFTFQAEWYVEPGYTDPLPVGMVVEEDIVLMVSARVGDFKEPEAQFLFGGCVVTGKSYSGMDAEKSGLITETTTVAYERLSVKWKDR